MKRIFFGFTISLVLIALNAEAQINTYNIGYINSVELLDALPEKKNASAKLLTLSDNYKKELEIMQKEYNKKYSDYITYQSSLAENIKLRRMHELTELENRIEQFMEVAQKDINAKEKEWLEPLKAKIKEAVQAVGVEKNFIVIYDLADPGIAFVSPDAVDANALVKAKLRIR